MVAPQKKLSFIDQLLAEQQQLATPVARFSDAHDRGATPATGPVYRDLIPLSAPHPGEQYAFEVDLDACTGCKACVASCHALNGLDDQETWRDTGLLVGGAERHPFAQTVTTACHHCADPACLNGCPVLAYEKDEVTGIVRHLDDQCIGCQYCVLKCPYDVPKYNERLGIVRKCDMCQSRLGAGEAPACVQACPTSAIRIVTVTVSVNGEPATDTSAFLPAAPDPAYTQPTTRYVTKRVLPDNLTASDASVLRPQSPHWPLVVMLTLMPLAVGCSSIALLATGSSVALLRWGWLAGAAGLGASVFHLGQPLRAWRIFLNVRKSWLSREALVFGAWFAAMTLAQFLPRMAPVAASLGLAGLYCSVMVYVDTQRQLWRFARTAPLFFGTALILGLAVTQTLRASSPAVSVALAVVVLFKLGFEFRILRGLDGDDETPTPARQTARLLTSRPLRPVNGLRFVSGLVGGVLLPFMLVTHTAPAGTVWLSLALVLGGELAERYLFFRAVDAPKMPGVPSA